MSGKRYFEDVEVGVTHEFGAKTVTAEEIVSFASKYDPQPFHLDEEAARRSIFGGLAASGWHTAAMMMRMLVDEHVGESASLGSPGFDDLRWMKPVRPGDRLRVRSTCIDKRESTSKPFMGSCRFQVEVLNQKDEVVMSLISTGLVLKRPAAEG